MGGAVSGAINAVGNIIKDPIGSITHPGDTIQGISSGITSGAGSDIANIVNSVVPNVPIANQAQLQQQLTGLGDTGEQASRRSQDSQGQANRAYQEAQQYAGIAQGAINNAQQVAQGPNVQGSIGLLGQTAAGGGPAQQAAAAQLQRGTDQAIAAQHALANSGNLSQQLIGQKAAMDNAAQLQQQNALNAATTQANMAAQAQGQYAGAAGQQAAQVAQNAAIQQQQTAQQAGLFGSAQGAANAYANNQLAAQQGVVQGQLGALGIQQQALGQTAQYKAQATGGLLNAGGGALSAAISDENTKKNIEYATPKDKASDISKSFGTKPSEDDDKSSSSPSSPLNKPSYNPDTGNKWQGEAQVKARDISASFSDEKGKKDIKKEVNKVSKFLDAIDPVTFEYKEPTGEMGKTPGTHIGVIAQQVEKAPGGKSMIIETSQGKGIDLASAVGTLLAAAAESHDRIKDLEEYLKSKRKK